MNILSLLKLLGGLGLFLYGMLTMGNALEKMAGKNLGDRDRQYLQGSRCRRLGDRHHTKLIGHHCHGGGFRQRRHHEFEAGRGRHYGC